MSVQMKLGRWMSGRVKVRNVDESVDTGDGLHYLETSTGMRWDEDGSCMTSLCGLDDLIHYLGPLELLPTPACADQAGTPVVSHVSTETAGEQLQRMRARSLALNREACVYRDMAQAAERAASDLDMTIANLEKEVEG